MQVSAVYACVRLIANTIGQLGLILYRKTPGGPERADDHPLAWILHDQPNPETAAFQYWACVGQHLALRGNHYSVIDWAKNGRVRALWPQYPDDVKVERKDGELSYSLRKGGKWDPIPAKYVLHIPDITDEGLIGLSPIQCAANTIGHFIAARDHGASFLRNGAKFNGIIERKEGLAWSAQAKTNFEEYWARTFGGYGNAGKTPVIEDGMSYKPVTVSPVDAQLLETLQFGIGDIARIFAVPNHLIGDLDRATFDNISEQDREYIKFHSQPRLIGIAQRVRLSLLSPAEQRQYYCEHMMEGLLRGDIESRAKAYKDLRFCGAINADEIRSKENMKPIPDGKGQTYLEPENMRPAGTYVPRQSSGPNQAPQTVEE